MDYIRFLEHLDREALGVAGGKGANLGELIKAGLPVPPGFVVTAGAYRTLLETDGLRDRIARRLAGLQTHDLDALTAAGTDVAKWILSTSVPAPIQAAVLQAYRKLGSELPVAVRSSATAEDLPTASFAGQQETFLHIHGEDQVMQHVRKCWASLWTPQAVSYRSSMGFDHLKVDLAVVVQAMVQADVACVMFTANPVTGARDEILISASYGLGESVVSGAVTPDTFTVAAAEGKVRQRELGSKETRIVPAGNGTVTEPVSPTDRSRYCLTDKDLAGLAALARQVQAHYGSPQDTEWALAGGKPYLLQARPITTLTETEDWDPEVLFKGKKLPFGVSMEYFPEPPTPLDAYQFNLKAIENFFASLGVLPPKHPVGSVERSDGRVALRIGPSRPSLSILWRLLPYLRRALRKDPADCWRLVETDWNTWLDRMKAAERKTHDAPGLARIIHRMTVEFDPILERRFHAVFMQGIMHDLMTGFWVRMAVGKQAATEMKGRLFRALPFRTALQNQAIGRLGKVAATHGKESPEFGSAMEAFLAEYGRRPARGMITMPSIPTLWEQPAVVVGLVDALMEDPAALEPDEAFRKQDQDLQAARAEVESRLGSWARQHFQRALGRARTAIITREESLFMSEGTIAFIRQVTLRLGEVMAKQGLLSEPGDLFFLFTNELQPMANGTLDRAETLSRVARRKQAYARVYAAHEQGQHWFITTGTFVPPAEPEKGASDTLKGTAASRGEAVGTVCVVRGPHEFSKLKKGDILVAPFTAPVWTPLFRVAAAVVTDVGSPVSHAAIVAREYGMPAVVAVTNATSVLQDGQRVRVDGTTGQVTIIKEK